MRVSYIGPKAEEATIAFERWIALAPIVRLTLRDRLSYFVWCMVTRSGVAAQAAFQRLAS